MFSAAMENAKNGIIPPVLKYQPGQYTATVSGDATNAKRMQKLHLPQEINLLKVANKSFAKYYHGMPGLQHVLLTQNEPHFLLLK